MCLSERILILAPTIKDARLAEEIVREAGFTPLLCNALEEICEAFEEGASVAVITQEAILTDYQQVLYRAVKKQPPWSNYPFIVLTPWGDDPPYQIKAFSSIANFTFVRIPLEVSFFRSVLQSAIHDRKHQYTLRDMMAENEQYIQALNEKQERFNLVLKAMDEGLWDWNWVSGEIYFSPRWKEMLGYSDDELPNSFSSWIELLHSDDHEQLYQEFDRYKENPAPLLKATVRMRHKDGSWHWIMYRGQALHDTRGDITRFIGVSADITEQKHHEEILKYNAEQAEAANRAKSEFLANMSHEIRTPMNNVIGNTELLFNTPLSDEQFEYVQAVHTSGEILLSLINDILDFSKIEAGELTLEEHPFSLCNLMNEIIMLFHEQAAKNNNILTLDCLEGKDYNVIGDHHRLRQIIYNLVGNAVKFTHNGKIFLRVSKKEQYNQTSFFLFEVIDEGIGIAPDKIKSIFGKFIQADSFTTKKYGGTGLGLAISKQLTELMGGTMGVESMPGEGSRFWVEVPFRHSPAFIAEAPLTISEIASLLKDKPICNFTSQFNAHVLLVEDYLPNQLLAKKMLEKMGCSIDAARDGEEALKMLKENHYDLVFMDCQMPEMDGFEATRRIRQDNKMAANVIIAMTANAIEGDREKCIAAGMDDYISKPIRAFEIERVLHKYLDHNIISSYSVD